MLFSFSKIEYLNVYTAIVDINYQIFKFIIWKVSGQTDRLFDRWTQPIIV